MTKKRDRREYHRQYHKDNREKRLIYFKNRYNREENTERCRIYNLKNPEQIENRRLLNLYGISLEEYNQQEQDQNECCALCGNHKSIDKRRLAVDHDHVTGKIRKLICRRCNNALGCANDDPVLLRKMAEYIEEYKK